MLRFKIVYIILKIFYVFLALKAKVSRLAQTLLGVSVV
jgi:hypothetical protein